MKLAALTEKSTGPSAPPTGTDFDRLWRLYSQTRDRCWTAAATADTGWTMSADDDNSKTTWVWTSQRNESPRPARPAPCLTPQTECLAYASLFRRSVQPSSDFATVPSPLSRAPDSPANRPYYPCAGLTWVLKRQAKETFTSTQLTVHACGLHHLPGFRTKYVFTVQTHDFVGDPKRAFDE